MGWGSDIARMYLFLYCMCAEISRSHGLRWKIFRGGMRPCKWRLAFDAGLYWTSDLGLIVGIWFVQVRTPHKKGLRARTYISPSPLDTVLTGVTDLALRFIQRLHRDPTASSMLPAPAELMRFRPNTACPQAHNPGQSRKSGTSQMFHQTTPLAETRREDTQHALPSCVFKNVCSPSLQFPSVMTELTTSEVRTQEWPNRRKSKSERGICLTRSLVNGTKLPGVHIWNAVFARGSCHCSCRLVLRATSFGRQGTSDHTLILAVYV